MAGVRTEEALQAIQYTVSKLYSEADSIAMFAEESAIPLAEILADRVRSYVERPAYMDHQKEFDFRSVVNAEKSSKRGPSKSA